MEFRKLIDFNGHATIARAPEGLDALVLGDLVRVAGAKDAALRPFLHIARDDQRMADLFSALSFFAPDIDIIRFPAWDCLPYDRVSPRAEIVARRIKALSDLLAVRPEDAPPLIVLTTVNAALQRVPGAELIKAARWNAAPGNIVDIEALQKVLSENGFSRSGTVVDPGDFAIRGGIIDIFAPGSSEPVRLDLFGDTLESIRTFDAQSQRTTGQLKSVELLPAGELRLTPEAVSKFRTGYAAAFGGVTSSDPLYEAISAGRKYQGMEHWLPLFHDGLTSIFDYADWHAVSLDTNVVEASTARSELISEYYTSRNEALEQDTFGAAPYKPLPPEKLYLTPDEWKSALGDAERVYQFTPFEPPEGAGAAVVSAEGGQGRTFAAERAEEGRNVYEAVRDHIDAARQAGQRVLVAAWTEGARERLAGILRDHDVAPVAEADSWAEATNRDDDIVNVAVLGLENGFVTPDVAIISEQDILGDRLVRRARKVKKASDFISELSALSPGDLVVHVDHGIGRFEGLRTIDVNNAPHDCLFLTYHGGDRLFLPVENIELLSRYGADEAGAQLDRLGGGGWQARKARLKQRVREIAEGLIKTAAARQLRKGDVLNAPDGMFDEFCARFPFEETEDQLNSIDDVLEDLSDGRPMDRLVCGDVGFGKTEVALRSAFVSALNGKQVAVVVPTTLLARQHFATFQERFKGYPVRIEQASRMVSRKELEETKKGISSGDVDIVIGTHALLSKSIKFRDLGLLIIDEEQHFGVKHKERLKEMRANVHVLTLTATPIPRTLQMALSGVRELSLISTPPLDRLAVRTFISPFDPVTIRETLLREHFRGGQSFYVAPRISDLTEIQEFLAEHVPEVKVAVAHGRMASGQLEDVMTAFYDRKYDVLLSTTIVESGLDIPTANTLVVHRADMFGLAQLYQLRGRVGRSKQRAYALMTVPVKKVLTEAADKRLRVLQSLDSLGAGFNLASHDLDIRGAGNLIGEEQSGHVKEVGFELYQDMLEEAVASLRDGVEGDEAEEKWSPAINIGTSVLLPESYISDLQVRLGLYRRLADLITQEDLEGFAAELRDRFGPVPEEVEHLLAIVGIKLLCRRANVASVDAGPKGAVVGFRNDDFENPAGLIGYINEEGNLVKLRPDHKLVVRRSWANAAERLKGVRSILKKLVSMAEAADAG
ncbi:MAG: transcription-repair coupling factor [Hyphomicrobiales bacterium]